MADAAALVRRLRSNRRTEQLNAAIALHRASAAGPAACNELVAAGCLPPLLEMISSRRQGLQEAAAGALAELTPSSERVRQASVAVFPSLVSLLSHHSDYVCVCATIALANCAVGSPERCAAIIAAGGHAALVQRTASGSAGVQAAACQAVYNMSSVDAACPALIEAGAFSALVKGLQDDTSDSETVRCAIEAIRNTALVETAGPGQPPTTSEPAAAAAAAAGAPAALVQLLRSCSDQGVLAAAAAAIGALAHSADPAARRAIDAARSVEALAGHLCSASSQPGVLADVSHALSLLLGRSPERCAALAAVPGALPRLVQLLGSTAGSGEQAMACAILRHMLAFEGTRRAAAAVAARAAPTLVAALGALPASMSVNGQHLLALISWLVAVGGGPHLLAAGVGPHLRRLAASSDPAMRQAATFVEQRLSTPRAPAAAEGSAAAGPAAAAGSTAEPAGAGVQQRPRRTCNGPGCSATRGLRLCGGCGTVRYCSEACSRAHWKAHRVECRRLQAEAAGGSSGKAGVQ